MGHMNPGGGTLVLACCLLTVATSCAAKVNRERCAARGFGETLTCGTGDRLRDALGEQGETLEKECRGCCKNGQVSYIQGRFEVCD